MRLFDVLNAWIELPFWQSVILWLIVSAVLAFTKMLRDVSARWLWALLQALVGHNSTP